jgi:hypothetical protein
VNELPNLEAINGAPFFESQPKGLTIVFDPEAPQLAYSIPIPKALDDRNQLNQIRFESKTLGKIAFDYSKDGKMVQSTAKS